MNSDNFQPLKARWPQLYQHAVFAERYAYSDPHTAFVKLRCFAETLVGILYRELRLPCEPADGFFERLNSPYFRDIVGDAVLQKLHAIRLLGNKAAHGCAIDMATSLSLVEEAYLLGQWLCKTYGGDSLDRYPTYIAPAKPSEHAEDPYKTAESLAEQLSAAKDELSRLAAAEKAAHAEIESLNQTLDETKLRDFKNASNKAAGTIDFKPANTRSLINIHDSFAGYALTDGQAELVNRLEQFLDGKTESVFLLKGYAGTGKTFVTKGLTEYFRAIGRNYVLAAPTGKASKVIASKTKSPAYTIHKTIYSFDDIAEYRDDDTDGTETFKFYAQLAVNSLSADTVYIVDEASMIADVYQEAEFFRFGTGYLLADFLKFVNLDHNDHSKKVIFIGDDAQLPPVGMNFSPALDADYLFRNHHARSTGYELSEVVRQKLESGVIANAIPLRKSLQAKVFNQLVIDFGHSDVRKVEHQDLMTHYLESCGGKINGEAIVIAHSNSDVGDYNRRIREHFFPGCPEVMPGDKVMAVSNSDAYPSLAERVIQQAGKEAAASDTAQEQNYILPHIDAAIERFPDNIWLKLDKAKVLLSLGLHDEALAFGLQVAKAKSNDYWAWGLLGDIVSQTDQEAALGCYCKALSCPADDKFTGKIRVKVAQRMLERNDLAAAKREIETVVRSKENEGYKIPEEAAAIASQAWFAETQTAASNRNFYQAHAPTAEALLFSELPWLEANVGEKYTVPGKEDKPKRKILLKTSSVPLEVSIPESKIGRKKLSLGDAVRVKGEFDDNQRFKIFVLEHRDSEFSWDVLYEAIGVVDHVNHEKCLLHFIINREIDGVISLSDLSYTLVEGDAIAVMLSKYESKHGPAYRVHQARSTDKQPSAQIKKLFCEDVRISNGMGFTESDIFVSPPLVAKHRIEDGQKITGTSLISYNKKRACWGWKAISIQI